MGCYDRNGILKPGMGIVKGDPINLDSPIGALKTQLSKLLLSVDRIGWTDGATSGRFDVRRTSRMLAGSERVFKQRFEVEAVTTAVSITVDLSSSMSGERALAAAQTAWALATAIERAGCEVQVTGLRSCTNWGSTDGRSMNDMTGERGKNGGVPNYHEGTIMVLKDWGHSCAERRDVFAYMGCLISGSTPDYHVTRTVVENMNLRQTARKVAIVVTDGVGDDELMKKFCSYSERRFNIPVLGIGIQTSPQDMLRSYEKFCCIGDVADLASGAIRTLIDQISGRRKVVVPDAEAVPA